MRPVITCRMRSPGRGWRGGCTSSTPLLALMLCLATLANGQTSPVADEYRLKSAFLFHFALLVDWPADAAKGADGSLVLCAFGDDDPLKGELESTVEGKTIGDHVLRVRHPRHVRELEGCHLLFIGKGESQKIPMLLATVRNVPVLTIGETEEFLLAGGIIRFCWEGKKLRFQINRQAAERARLKISSRLLLLAKSVSGGD